MHKLFDVVRTELKSMPPSQQTKSYTVEFLATRLLNCAIRPFLSEWHPRLEAWKGDSAHSEADWPHASTCREHLEQTRLELVVYALELAKLVGVSNPALILDTKGSRQPSEARSLVLHACDHGRQLRGQRQFTNATPR
jgi:hypothetical protein